MRNIDNGEEKEKKKIPVEIVATNIVASQPPKGDRLQRRPLMPIKTQGKLSSLLTY